MKSCSAPGSSLKAFVDAVNDVSASLSRTTAIHEAVAMDAFTNFNACKFASQNAWLCAMQPVGGRGPCAMCFYVRVTVMLCKTTLRAQGMSHVIMDCDDKPFKFDSAPKWRCAYGACAAMHTLVALPLRSISASVTFRTTVGFRKGQQS